MAAVIALDSAIAWAYVIKRRVTDYPVVDLTERFYVLRPFRYVFPDQYKFPAVLWPNLKGALGLGGQAEREFWVSDPLLGHRLAPNALVLEQTWTWRATNPQGFIVTDADDPLRTYAVPKSPSVFRIIVLGGSTVEGDGATGSLNALPAELLQVLARGYAPTEGPLRRFEVINAGVGGYMSHQELLYYLSELRFFEPDLVISYNGWNDESRVNGEMARSGTSYPWFRTQSTEQQRSILADYYTWTGTARAFARRTATRVAELIDGIATVHVATRAAARLVAEPGAGTGLLAQPAFFAQESVVRYAENVTVLGSHVIGRGGQFAWFLQPLVGLGAKPPSAFRERDVVANKPEEMARRRLFFAQAKMEQERFARSSSACVADLTDVFDGNGDTLFEDSGHLFDAGNVLVAQRVARELERCGIVAQRPLDAAPGPLPLP